MNQDQYPTAKLVFVVTCGEYSDRHITGVYSTRELAEAAVKHENQEGDDFSDKIEEWFLDNGPTIPGGYKLFTITMRKDGSVIRCLQSDCSSPDKQTKERFRPCRYDDTPGDAWSFDVISKDLQHAIKIVNEKRVQFIANNDWPTEF